MRTTGAKTIETMLMSLMRMFKLGPDVSLHGSPTVSPITAAPCTGFLLPSGKRVGNHGDFAPRHGPLRPVEENDLEALVRAHVPFPQLQGEVAGDERRVHQRTNREPFHGIQRQPRKQRHRYRAAVDLESFALVRIHQRLAHKGKRQVFVPVIRCVAVESSVPPRSGKRLEPRPERRASAARNRQHRRPNGRPENFPLESCHRVLPRHSAVSPPFCPFLPSPFKPEWRRPSWRTPAPPRQFANAWQNRPDFAKHRQPAPGAAEAVGGMRPGGGSGVARRRRGGAARQRVRDAQRTGVRRALLRLPEPCGEKNARKSASRRARSMPSKAARVASSLDAPFFIASK